MSGLLKMVIRSKVQLESLMTVILLQTLDIRLLPHVRVTECGLSASTCMSIRVG